MCKIENGLHSVMVINDENFIVPNYQRGYKWKSKDVEYLIDDIADIAVGDTSDYCLQPIVVAPQSNNYILVDGQQRLTTIWLIINWAKNNGFKINFNFDIFYETRDESNEFLNNVKENVALRSKTTCDTLYFKQAIQTIQSKKEKLLSFLVNLKKNVKIIWYEIDPLEGAAHFERLNNAKIGLTNAELVKAFLFTNSNYENRTRMACEWDDIEYRLQDELFFSFITTKDSIYKTDANRIELILDLYADTNKEKKEQDQYVTYSFIFNTVKNGKTTKDVWQDILNIYFRIFGWYNDNFLFNMVGFLIECNGEKVLRDIWVDTKGKSINEIKENVRKRVIAFLPSEEYVRDMVYKDPKTRNILLLFNILSYMSVIDKPDKDVYKYMFNEKFLFNLYKNDNWDKEHVHATASQSLQSKVEWVNWLKGLNLDLVKSKLDDDDDLKTECVGWIQKAKNIKLKEEYEQIKEDKNETFKILKRDKFDQIFSHIVQAIEGEDEELNLKQNSIGNLVLLNANINRAGEYKTAPFSTKRRIIMERVKKGQFVPIGTQNVFMKVYTPNPGHFYKWEKEEAYEGNEKSDRECYIDAIVETFNRLK